MPFLTLIPKSKQNARISQTREVFERDVKADLIKLKKENSQTRLIVFEFNEDKASTSNADHIVLSEHNQTDCEFQVLAQRAADASQSGLGGTLSAAVNKLASTIDAIKNLLTQLQRSASDQSIRQPVVVNLVDPQPIATLRRADPI